MADRSEKYDALIRAPFGRIGVRMRDGLATAIDFLPGAAPLREPVSPEARRLADEIRAYLRDPDAQIRAVAVPGASPFRQKVWRALRRIPRGTTRSYGALARELRTSARAVGGACRDNPLPLVVPCHRVVAHGGVGGFMGARAGFPMRVKQWLLAHEGAG